MVKITAGSIELERMLVMPKNLQGMVVFAHGSGSSRLSPRNNFVANILNNSKIAIIKA